ncbi:hypothetical protein ACWFNE_12175 [Cellulomonas sp. NPDC055163]
MTSHRARRRRRPLSAVLAATVLIGGSAFVWQSTYAAFSARTTNPANSWAAGNVNLSDSRGGPMTGTAMWSSGTASNLKPGSTSTKCIRVTYGGSLAANVRMFVATGDLTGTGLGSYLRFTVDEGTQGSADDCADFGGTVTRLYNSGTPGTTTAGADGSDSAMTLATFAGTKTNYSNGVSTWAPATAGQTRTYRITWTVLDDNAAAGTTATASFTWEAQNT